MIKTNSIKVMKIEISCLESQHLHVACWQKGIKQRAMRQWHRTPHTISIYQALALNTITYTKLFGFLLFSFLQCCLKLSHVMFQFRSSVCRLHKRTSRTHKHNHTCNYDLWLLCSYACAWFVMNRFTTVTARAYTLNASDWLIERRWEQ